MKVKIFKMFLLIFFISLNNIHAVDITEREIEAFLRGEYNRAFNYYGDISIIGSLKLDNMFGFKLGFSLGKAAVDTNVKTHASAAIIPFPGMPLDFRVSYIYNGIPDYNNHTHTILPVISYNGGRAGISIGPSLRFTSFFGEAPQFESILSFSAYFNFINNDTLCIGISCANFNDFQAKNFGAYSFKFNTAIRMDSSWQIINEIELMQSGGDGLSAIFYGFGWRGGARFSW